MHAGHRAYKAVGGAFFKASRTKFLFFEKLFFGWHIFDLTPWTYTRGVDSFHLILIENTNSRNHGGAAD